MAEILGSRLCMESLQTDIQDVQWTVNDICSRTGPIDISSWKFPDKLSWELDLEQLLEMYTFSEDEKEENEVAHIALYELLIDRLVLLVQGTAVYLNQIQELKGGSVTHPSSTSVGLAVKHFWSQLTNLQSLMQQLNSQSKMNAKKVTDLEKNLKKFASENSLHAPSSVSMGNTASSPDRLSAGSSHRSHSPPKEISCDESNKGSQTYETAFVPCEACDVVQKKMRESGDLIVNVCQNQGLPSSLRKYRPQVSHVRWLSYNDVSRWMSEQDKDLQRLVKHIEQMAATIDPLKAEVSAFQRETKQAESRAKQCEKDLQLEKETQAAVKRQFEVKLQEAERQHELTLADLHRQKEDLLRKHTTLASELDQRKVESTQLESKLHQWECKGRELEKDLEEKEAVVSRLEGVEKEVVTLTEDLSKTKTQLDATNKSLSKEQGKNKSAAQHKQQVMAKQESLADRIRELGQENDDLRDQVYGLEEEKQQLEESLQETKQQTQQLEKERKEQEIIIRNLNNEKSALEESIQETEAQIKAMEERLEEAKERERLIVEYPDLNGPVNADLQGTGDIVVDMENQVKANVTRIGILEEQNTGLRRSITKILTRGRPNGSALPQQPKATAPMPLWQTESLNNMRHETACPPQVTNTQPPKLDISFAHAKTSSPPDNQTMGSFTVSKAPSENKPRRPASGKSSGFRGGSGGGGRGNSGVGFVPVNTTSIGAYKQIKKSASGSHQDETSDPRGKRVPSSFSNAEKSSHPRGGDYGGGDSTPMYVCEHCDRMYSKARDLEIHRSYCTA